MKLWNRNFVLLMQGAFVSNIGDMLYSFAIGWLCIVNQLSTGVLMLLTVAISVAGVFFVPAYSSVVVDILPAHELVRAKSIESSSNMIVKVVSRAISGLLLITINFLVSGIIQLAAGTCTDNTAICMRRGAQSDYRQAGCKIVLDIMAGVWYSV